jgi:hypothetical protein
MNYLQLRIYLINMYDAGFAMNRNVSPINRSLPVEPFLKRRRFIPAYIDIQFEGCL